MTEPIRCDVVVVGLGPTGATLANVLGQYGWSVVGLERDPDVYYSPRAVHFDDEVMRIFQSVGLADTIGAASEPFREMEFALAPKARAVLRGRVGSQDEPYGYAGAWWFHQPTLERQLRDGLARFDGVAPRYGVEVVDVAQDEDGVTATCVDGRGEHLTVRGRYLVGCDGGRSCVRPRANLALESADFDQDWVVVDTKARCGGKEPSLPALHRQVCDPRQPVTYVPITGPYYEWQFMVTGNKSEREAADPVFVRRQLRRFVDLDKIDILRIAYYKFHALWAERWRRGRVILAGDAAHQMPPFLGQGMCSGIRDAHALGWRLDLVLKGLAGPGLFDSYERERGRHVRDIIDGAMFLGRVIQTRSRALAFLRNWLLFRPGRLFPAYNRLFIALANRKRPLSTGLLGTNRTGLAGRLALQPRVETNAGPVLLDHVLGDGFSLLSPAGSLDGHDAAVAHLGRTVPLRHVRFGGQAAGSRVGDRDRVLTRWFDRHRADFVLIRPDRYVFDGGRARDLPAVVDRFVGLFPRSPVAYAEAQ